MVEDMIAGKSSGKTQIPEETNFTFVRGDSFEYEIEVWTTNATSGIQEAVDLSSATIVGKVIDSKGEVVMPVTTSYSGNLLTISFDQDITKVMSKGKYEYDLEIYYNSKYTTVLRGWINLVGDITYYDVVTQYFYTAFSNVVNSFTLFGEKIEKGSKLGSIVSLFIMDGKFFNTSTFIGSYVTIQELMRKYMPSMYLGSIVTINGILSASQQLNVTSYVTMSIVYTSETS